MRPAAKFLAARGFLATFASAAPESTLARVVPQQIEARLADGAPVALLVPYWAFWEASYPGNLRKTREDMAATAARALPDFTFRTIVIDQEPTAQELADLAGCMAILVISSMAAPPAWVAAAVNTLDLPIVLWAAQQRRSSSDSLTAAHITADGAAVGTPQIASLLRRQHRPFLLVVGDVDAEEAHLEVATALRAALCSFMVKHARLARLGETPAGYDCVDCPDDVLEKTLGVSVLRLPPSELVRRYQAPDPEMLARVQAEVAATFDIAEEATLGEGLDRTMRLAAALERLDIDATISCGAMNCHIPELREGNDPGVSACFALGRETTRGRPWTCTGDVLTAVALLIAKSSTGAAMYHEIEALDSEHNEALLANTGEHDLNWLRRGERPLLAPNPWFRTERHCGTCASFACEPGPATLIGLVYSPHDSPALKLVAAEGSIATRDLADTGTMTAAFAFGAGSEPIREVWRRWVLTGIHHHSAAARGHIAKEVRSVAALLDVAFEQVS